MSKQSISNILTIDVEDYFMVSAFKNVVKFRDWNLYENRLHMNTEKILRILDKHNVKATFFVLGWIAEKYSFIVKKIDLAGHEIASHGYAHKLIYEQKPDDFRDDVRKTRLILEDIIQKRIIGYRAPSYSLTSSTLWAMDILVEEGYEYDSSIFPCYHARGGIFNESRYPNVKIVGNRQLYEIPLSTIRVLGQNIPIAGGGYFRFWPYFFIRRSIELINNDKQPAVIYLHPWEFDPEQPRIKIDWINSYRHYLNLNKTESKFDTLLSELQFHRVIDYLRGRDDKKS